jgi:hypothetical protein
MNYPGCWAIAGAGARPVPCSSKARNLLVFLDAFKAGAGAMASQQGEREEAPDLTFREDSAK